MSEILIVLIIMIQEKCEIDEKASISFIFHVLIKDVVLTILEEIAEIVIIQLDNVDMKYKGMIFCHVSRIISLHHSNLLLSRGTQK